MVSGQFRRRTIALVAAYAVALQTIFLASAPLAPADPIGSLGALCSHDGADGTGHSPGHDVPCAAMCAAAGQGVTGPLPSEASALPATTRVVQAALPISQWTLTHVARTEPHAPRAPPLA